MSLSLIRRVFAYSKAVKEKNSLRNISRMFNAFADKEESKYEGQSKFVQVNADLGDGKLYRITGATYDIMSQSIRVFIDKEHPLTYPEFWPYKFKPKNNGKQK